MDMTQRGDDTTQKCHNVEMHNVGYQIVHDVGYQIVHNVGYQIDNCGLDIYDKSSNI